MIVFINITQVLLNYITTFDIMIWNRWGITKSIRPAALCLSINSWIAANGQLKMLEMNKLLNQIFRINLGFIINRYHLYVIWVFCSQFFKIYVYLNYTFIFIFTQCHSNMCCTLVGIWVYISQCPVVQCSRWSGQYGPSIIYVCFGSSVYKKKF